MYVSLVEQHGEYVHVHEKMNANYKIKLTGRKKMSIIIRCLHFMTLDFLFSRHTQERERESEFYNTKIFVRLFVTFDSFHPSNRSYDAPFFALSISYRGKEIARNTKKCESVRFEMRI